MFLFQCCVLVLVFCVGGGLWRRLRNAGAVNIDPLDELNNRNSYNLKDKILSHYGNDINTNPYLNINIDSNFFDQFTFTSHFSTTQLPIFLSLNIRSLQSNHLNLRTFITDMLNKNVLVEVIALQEIWQLPHPETVMIPGFNFIFKDRKNGRGGGVGFYIADKYNYTVIDNLSTFNEKTFECLTLELLFNKKKHL